MQTPEMREVLKWGRMALIFLSIFLATSALNTLKHWHEVSPAYNSITVSGQGETFAVPDLATFSFSVSFDAKTVTEAQSQVTVKMDSLLAKLKTLGIAEKDIKTTDYSVYPKYVYQQVYCITTPCPPGKQVQEGYTANHSVTVKVRQTDDTGAALAIVGEAGANNLSSISFTIDDMDKIVSQARALAIKDAKEKAEALSDELGVKLVRVVSYNDSSDGGPQFYREGMGEAMMVSQAKAPTLPAGENKVSVIVSITYEIR